MIRIFSILFFAALVTSLQAQVADSGAVRKIRQWNLNSSFTEETELEFDTVFSLFHRFRLADRYSPINSYPGNYGLPFYQMNFFDRICDHDKFLYHYYYPLMHLPERAVFMDTQVPFTELVWSFGAPRETSEQTFRIRHSQSINRRLNFGLIYDIIYSLGQYNYQRAENKTFTFFSSYRGQRYKMYFSSGINNLLSYENGGITSTDQLAAFPDTRDVPVNLGGLNLATSTLRNRNLLLVQRYTIGGNSAEADTVETEQSEQAGLSGTFSHILTWENNKRMYRDEYPKGGFYDLIYISDVFTFDSLRAGFLKNTVRFDFAAGASDKFRLGGGIGLRNEIMRYSQIVPTHDTLLADTALWRRSNNAVTGKLFNDIGGRFSWSAAGELYFTGYRAGDLSVTGEILKTFAMARGEADWLITGGISSNRPSFWFENWGSNHFEWKTSPGKEFRIDAGTRISYPARDATLRFNYALIDNFTYFDTEAKPVQHGGGLSVVSVALHKSLKAWKFHFSGDFLFQQSSNPSILDLPLASARAAGWFEHLFIFKQTGGRLNTQIGFDLTYNTEYYAMTYMPATGRYHNQDLVRTGNYPYIDVFLNLKLQRTRFFIMFDHVNAGLMGLNYSMIPLYPMNIRMLRYGLAWTFYN